MWNLHQEFELIHSSMKHEQQILVAICLLGKLKDVLGADSSNV